MAAPYFTIGHSTRQIDEFVALLRESEIRLVVDVCTVPRSRKNPQFNTGTLADTLTTFQIGYEHMAASGTYRRR